jgi:hypothetical protein
VARRNVHRRITPLGAAARGIVAALVGVPMLLAAAPVLGAGTAAAADAGTCDGTLTRADLSLSESGTVWSDGAWGTVATKRVIIRKDVVIPDGCTYSFSFISYETEGPTWPTSGTQRFIDHDTITLSAANRVGTLTVEAPKCFGQVDLYWGTTIYDGGTGAGHGPVPKYPDEKIQGIITGSNGGSACQPPVTPSADIQIQACNNNASTAVVTLAVSEGAGSSDFTVWARTGAGAYAQVGGTTTLPSGADRTASVNVPLVEDQPVTIQVRVGDTIVRTFDPITADCVQAPPPATGKFPSYGMFLVDVDPDGSGPAAAVRYGIQVQPQPDNDNPSGVQAVPLNTKGGGKSPAATMSSLGLSWTMPGSAWVNSHVETGFGLDANAPDAGERALWVRFKATGMTSGAETMTVVEAVTHDGVYKPNNFAVAGEAAKVKTVGDWTYVYFYAPSGK